MDYAYKVVPFIGQNRGTLSAADVAIQMESIINHYASHGWEFYQLSDVNIEVQPGCIGGLLGAKAEYVRFDQLIFRTDRTSLSTAPWKTVSRSWSWSLRVSLATYSGLLLPKAAQDL
jgi:hypothetical protein